VDSLGIKDFSTNLDCFSNLIFISASVYSRSKIVPFLRVGYYSINTCAPHVSMLLAAIEEKRGNFTAHPFKIVEWKQNEKSHWNVGVVFPKLRNIVSVVSCTESRNRLAQKNAFSHPLGPVPSGWSLRDLKFAVAMNDEMAYRHFFMINEVQAVCVTDKGGLTANSATRAALWFFSFVFCRAVRKCLVTLSFASGRRFLGKRLNISQGDSGASGANSILGDGRL
jgi:hypothetical protein